MRSLEISPRPLPNPSPPLNLSSQSIPPKKNSQPTRERKNFTPDEDMKIIILLKEGKSYKEIAPFLNNRSPKSVKERYKNYLDPGINKKSFTPEEKEWLLWAVEEFGRCWREIQVHFFPQRTDNQLLNTWVCLTKQMKSKNIETPELLFDRSSDEEFFQPSEASKSSEVLQLFGDFQPSEASQPSEVFQLFGDFPLLDAETLVFF